MNPMQLLYSELKRIPEYARTPKFRLAMHGEEAKHPNEPIYREKYGRITKLLGILKDIRDFIDEKNTSANVGAIKDILTKFTPQINIHIRAYLDLNDDLAAKEAQIKEDVNFWKLLERIYFVKTHIYPRRDKTPEQECAAVTQAYNKLISHEEKSTSQPSKSAFSFLWSTPQEKLQKILSELDTTFQPSGDQTIQLGTINEVIDTCLSAVVTDASIDMDLILLKSKIAAYNQTKPQPKLEAKQVAPKPESTQVEAPEIKPADIIKVETPKPPGYKIKTITEIPDAGRLTRCDRFKHELKDYVTIINNLRTELTAQNANKKNKIELPPRLDRYLSVVETALADCIPKFEKLKADQSIDIAKDLPRFLLIRLQSPITTDDLEQITDRFAALFEWINTVDLTNALEKLANSSSTISGAATPQRPASPAAKTNLWADQEEVEEKEEKVEDLPLHLPSTCQSATQIASSSHLKPMHSHDDRFPSNSRVFPKLPSADDLKQSRQLDDEISSRKRSDSQASSSTGAMSPRTLSNASVISALHDHEPMIPPIPQTQPAIRRRSPMDYLSGAAKALGTALSYLKQKIVNAFLCLFCCLSGASQNEDHDDKAVPLAAVADDRTTTLPAGRGSSTYTGPLASINKNRRPGAIDIIDAQIQHPSTPDSTPRHPVRGQDTTPESPSSTSSSSTPTRSRSSSSCSL